MEDREFKNGLAELRKGHIPSNQTALYYHARNALVDALAYLEAVSECAERLKNDNAVLRERIENV